MDFEDVDGTRTPIPREEEITPGYDVLGEAGVVLGVAFERRDTGHPSDLWPDPSTEGGGEDRSSLWYQRFRLETNGDVVPIPDAATRVDVETGHETMSARHVSLFVREDLAQAAGLPEPSVLYDNVRFASPAATELLYADARVGQFVEHREQDCDETPCSPGGTFRNPFARRYRAGPASGTCWDESWWLTDLSETEGNLVPEASVGGWASPRLESTVTGRSSASAHRNATSLAECLLRAASESPSAVPAGPWSGAIEQQFAAQVRERFAGNYLSLANSLWTPGPAVIQSRRFTTDTLVPAGTLSVELNGLRFDATLTSASTFEEAAGRLSAAMTPATGRPVVTFQQFAASVEGEERQFYRMAVHTSLSESSEHEIRVLDSELAQDLGFPIEQVGRSQWIDPRNGDYDDRLTGCESREPCVPDSAEGAGDGTCGRVSDCLAPGLSLLNEAFRDAELVMGQAPRRTGQIGLCVPLEANGGSSDTPCMAGHVSQIGTNQSFRGFTREPASGDDPCDDGYLSNTGLCLSCEDGDTDPPLTSPSGTPRLCRNDLDCNVTADCTGPAGCIFGTTDFFCTHLNVAQPGVPAGQGFCARPRTLCSADERIERPLATWHYASPPPLCGGMPAGVTTMTVCRSPRAIDPAVDFEPLVLECIATGCADCTGAYGPQSYCIDDGECPSGHRCLLDRQNEITLPACILRPIVGDGRLNDSREATDPTTARIQSVSSSAATALSVAPNTIAEGLQSVGPGLRAQLPLRELVSIQGPRCSGETVQHRDLRLLLTGLRAHTLGARVTMDVDEAEYPGAGDMILDLFLDGRVDLFGRLEGDYELLGVWHGLDTDVGAHLDAEGVRIRLRPYLARSDPESRLGFRARVDFMRRLSPTDPSVAEAAEISNLSVDYSSQQGPLLGVLRAIFGTLFPHFWDTLLPDIIITLAVENLNGGLGDSPGGTTALGDAVAGILFQDSLGPALFGEEIIPLNARTLVEGATVELSQDDSRAGVLGPSLGVYARRFPPRTPFSTPPLRPSRDLFTGLEAAAVCRLAGQRDPDCLELTSELGIRPSLCPPCGAEGQECCGSCCGTACPLLGDPTLTCAPSPTSSGVCRPVTP